MFRLKITINSFSYRQGIPDDPSGNGGGHVFDCRAITNPGTLPEYKNLSGKDAPVIAFLKNYSEADRFVDNAFRIVGRVFGCAQNNTEQEDLFLVNNH